MRIHLSEKKARELWPHTQGTFDGVILDLPSLCLFTTPENDQRHRRELVSLTERLLNNQPVLLRNFARVIGQQRSHAASWPTPFLVQRPAAYQGREQARLMTLGHSAKTVWDQPIARPPPSVFAALRALARPKQIGDNFRTTGPVRLTVIADTSGTGIGAQITDHVSGIRTVAQQYLTPHQRTMDHTPQEAHGLAEATMAAIIHHLNIAAKPNQLIRVHVGS